VLDRLFGDAERNDPPIDERARTATLSEGQTIYNTDFLNEASMPVAPEAGRALYMLVRISRPRLLVGSALLSAFRRSISPPRSAITASAG
jgi:hypothetical protein